MKRLLQELRQRRLLWLLPFVPLALGMAMLRPAAHSLLFVLCVLAIVPLAVLLSVATESLAAKAGDTVGGLLNATFGNLTELIIALAALRAGEYELVKSSVAGAIITNSLFVLGVSFLVGGLKHRHQHYSQTSARLQTVLLFLAAFAMLIPSAVSESNSATASIFTHRLSLCLAILLIAVYLLGLVFSLGTHRDLFDATSHAAADEVSLAPGTALATLAGATVLVALVSEVFVESIQKAAVSFGMTPAFVGFIVVPLVGGAAEMASAFIAARRDRLDLSVSIALGSASQIALFVVPALVLSSYLIGPQSMSLHFWPSAIIMMLVSTMTTFVVTNGGRSTWFVGVLLIVPYLIFATTLYLLPARSP